MQKKKAGEQTTAILHTITDPELIKYVQAVAKKAEMTIDEVVTDLLWNAVKRAKTQFPA